MRAAVAAMRRRHAGRVVVAVPVAAAETLGLLGREADAVVCVNTPHIFTAVGEWYEDFPQVTDAEVRHLLARAAPPHRAPDGVPVCS